MSGSDADVLRRVLVQIAAQRQHLHEGGSKQEHADRYHEQLDRLDEAGYDVKEFRKAPSGNHAAIQRGNFRGASGKKSGCDD